MMRSWIRLAILGATLAVTLPMTGCSTLQVWLGLRVRLEKTPVARIEADLPEGPAMYPGEKTPLVVTVIRPDGKSLMTEGAGEGKVLWEDLRVMSDLVSVNRKGIVAMPFDPRTTFGKKAHLTVTVPSHPGISAELEISLRYDHGYVADFSGRNGRSGSDGRDGMDGGSGSMGSIDPENPSAGGDGGDGTDGTDGGDGGPGEDAPPVLVRLSLQPGNESLLQASVFGRGQYELFLVDTARGSLTVKAEGGAGGAGGRGGRGGRGGSGGSGSPSGFSGRNGFDGRDGGYGAPGRGGPITIWYDPATKPYLSLLRFFNRDGNGRPGPGPVFQETPMPPLW